MGKVSDAGIKFQNSKQVCSWHYIWDDDAVAEWR
jgi:hypothetical protein